MNNVAVIRAQPERFGDGVGGLHIDMTGCEPEREHGVDALIRLVAEHPGELAIVPLTNIAMAAAKDPGFVANVKSLHIMGGPTMGAATSLPPASSTSTSTRRRPRRSWRRGSRR